VCSCLTASVNCFVDSNCTVPQANDLVAVSCTARGCPASACRFASQAPKSHCTFPRKERGCVGLLLLLLSGFLL
jgi:hypothetical protein